MIATDSARLFLNFATEPLLGLTDLGVSTGGIVRNAASTECGQICAREFYLRGFSVLFQVGNGRRAGDEQHNGRSGEQPGKQHLGG